MGLGVDEGLACENVTRLAEAARDAGATVTLTADALTLDDGPGLAARLETTLSMHAALLKEHPSTGIVIAAQLRRAEEYCQALSDGRVRLCKGGYDASAYAAYPARHDVDRSFVRCLRALMAGRGYPMIATHDQRAIGIASALAVLNEREPGSYEHQMVYGVRLTEQRRLVRLGAQLRVLVPYGDDWHGYLVRRLAYR
jgi:proline dehydrogenase